ncbi:TPR-like protein [Coprinopsis marcescibilis]|uniref:TPR-like protein n=1 Tax=Coprinopsis marcescibilis TaxID=230819 RepID=A0A5C3KTB8_COPMA|nr:TPR-like protein [Coprinopsis marcescibilis]
MEKVIDKAVGHVIATLEDNQEIQAAANHGVLAERKEELAVAPGAGSSVQAKTTVNLSGVEVHHAGRDIVNTVNNLGATNHIYQYYSGADGEINEALRRLPDPKGCFWDRSRACLPGTRTSHLEELVSWVHDRAAKTARGFLVADAAGSGKTAFAHTACHRFHSQQHLVASYFCRQRSARSTAADLLGIIIRGLLSVHPQVKMMIGELLVRDHTLASASPVRQFDEIVIPVATHLPQDRPFVIIIDGLDEEFDIELLTLLRDAIRLLPPTFKFVLTTRPELRVMHYLDNQPHIRRCSHSLAGILNYEDLRKYIKDRLSASNYGMHVTDQLIDGFVTKAEGVFLWAATVLNHLETAFNPISELEDIVNSKSDHWVNDKDATQKLDDIYARILSQLKWSDSLFTRMYRTIMGTIVTLIEPLSPIGLAALLAPEAEGVTVDDVSKLRMLLRPLLQRFETERLDQPIRILHLSIREYLTTRAPQPYRLSVNTYHEKISRYALLTIQKELNSTNVPSLGYTIGNDDRRTQRIPLVVRQSIPDHLWYCCRFLTQHLFELPLDQVELPLFRLVHQMIASKHRALLEATASMGDVINPFSLREWLEKLPHEPVIHDYATLQDTGKALVEVAACLEKEKRHAEALVLAEEASHTYRQLISVDPKTYEVHALKAFRALSSCLTSLRRYDDALLVIEESLEIANRLAATSGEPSSQHMLAQLFHHRSVSLTKLGRHDEALATGTQRVEIYRVLVTSDPLFVKSLALSLHSQAWSLGACGRHMDALPHVEEAIQIARTLEHDVSFLADCLYAYASSLWGVGRHDAALDARRESVDILRKLADADPANYDYSLASSLHKMAYELGIAKRYEEAIPVVEEAIDIRRRFKEKEPITFAGQLSDSLSAYQSLLSSVGRHDEALVVLRELASADPVKFAPRLARSLQKLVGDLESCKQYEEVVRLAEEAIEVSRKLTEKDPGLYTLDLVNALSGHSRVLSMLGQHKAAVGPAKEAVDVCRGAVEQDAEKLEPSLASSLHRLARTLDAVRRRPDGLVAIQEAVGIRRRLFARDPSSFARYLADSLENCVATLLALKRPPLDVVEPGKELVEAYRVLVSRDPGKFELPLATALYKLGKSLAGCKRYEEAVVVVQESGDIRKRLVEGLSDVGQSLPEPNAQDVAPSPAESSEEPGTGVIEDTQRNEPGANQHSPFTSSAHLDASIQLASSLHFLARCLGHCNRNEEGLQALRDAVDIRRKLVIRDPKVHLKDLAESLDNYVWCLVELEMEEAALDPATEAVKAYRKLVEMYPGKFDKKLKSAVEATKLILSVQT